MLLAREYEFSCSERIGQQPRFFRDPPCIERYEEAAETKRDPNPRAIQRGEFRGRAAGPRKGQMIEGEQKRQSDHKSDKIGRRRARQRDRGNHHGRKRQDDERVVDSAS